MRVRTVVVLGLAAGLACGGPSAPPSTPPSTPPTTAGPTSGPAPTADPPVGPIAGAPGTIRGTLVTPYARLADSVVFLTAIPGGNFEPPADPALMDQQRRMFQPHVLPILAGTTVAFPNTDDIRHSVYAQDGSPTAFDLGVYDAGEVKHVRLDTPGVVHLGCRKHQEMGAWIVVCQNPHFVLVPKEATGAFELGGVPAGRWDVSFFHERLRPRTQRVTVEPGATVTIEFRDLERR